MEQGLICMGQNHYFPVENFVSYKKLIEELIITYPYSGIVKLIPQGHFEGNVLFFF
jgi:hypothetical protein